MDKPLSVHEKKTTKQTKPKRKPVKVVYISNPVKVNTTASEFRALVQELTGQDAGSPERYKYSETDGVGSRRVGPDGIKTRDDHALKVPRFVQPDTGEVPKSSDLTFEPYDDVFVPQMIQNLSGFLPSSLLL